MFSYDIYAFGQMMRDQVRTSAYAEALRRSIRADSVVLDLGTGVGIWAMLACRFGARKVYAVEVHNVIQIARQVAELNGYSDRIEFIQDRSSNITLPEQADVLVSDMHGVIPMFEDSIPSIIDARNRMLKPGGMMIPQAETLWAVPVESRESYDHAAVPWVKNAYDFVWKPVLQVAVNDWFKVKGKLTPADFFAEPQPWAKLDYQTLESPNVSGELSWTATRDGTGHGLAIWFDSLLADGVGFSNAPGLPVTTFGQAFFPWPEPVTISAGDTISVELRCDLVGSEHLWRWKTAVWPQGEPSEVKVEFRQSTFFAVSLSSAGLHKREANHVPELAPRGIMQQFVLSLMNGQNSIRSIAEQTANRFPEVFSDCGDAQRAVADLSQKYAR